MRNVIMALAVLLLLAGCRTKKQTSVTRTEVVAATDSTLTASQSEETLRRLSELLSLTLSSRVAVIDSLHTHSETVLTLDADGKVTGGTRRQTMDRHRVTHSSEQADSRQEQSLADSTARHAGSSSAFRAEGRRSEERREEATVRPVPAWERATKGALALVCPVVIIAAVVLILRRWRAKMQK